MNAPTTSNNDQEDADPRRNQSHGRTLSPPRHSVVPLRHADVRTNPHLFRSFGSRRTESKASKKPTEETKETNTESASAVAKSATAPQLGCFSFEHLHQQPPVHGAATPSPPESIFEGSADEEWDQIDSIMEAASLEESIFEPSEDTEDQRLGSIMATYAIATHPSLESYDAESMMEGYATTYQAPPRLQKSATAQPKLTSTSKVSKKAKVVGMVKGLLRR